VCHNHVPVLPGKTADIGGAGDTVMEFIDEPPIRLTNPAPPALSASAPRKTLTRRRSRKALCKQVSPNGVDESPATIVDHRPEHSAIWRATGPEVCRPGEYEELSARR
jgi:hypothetical protein